MPQIRRPSLCVVNYNGAKHLARTLDAISLISREFSEILVVDNASTDGSMGVVRAKLPEARIVELETNGGPGVARNVGLKQARSDRILFIDNDVVPESRCAELLDNALDSEDGAVMAVPQVRFATDPDSVQYEGADSHFMGMLICRGAGPRRAEDPGQATDRDSLISACFLVDRSRWGADVLFDERLFFYLEDHELGLRARLMGFRIVSEPKASCLHGDGQAGISIRATGGYTALRVRETILNRWQTILKLYSLETLLLLSPSLLLFELFQFVGAAKKGWLREWGSAAARIGRIWPDLRKRRRAFQEQRRVADGRVLSGGPIPFNAALHVTPLERWARRVLDAISEANWRLVHGALGSRS